MHELAAQNPTQPDRPTDDLSWLEVPDAQHELGLTDRPTDLSWLEVPDAQHELGLTDRPTDRSELAGGA